MRKKKDFKLKILNIALLILAVIALIYIMLYIFAPHQLQRLGSFLGRRLSPGQKGHVIIATAEKGGHYHRLGLLIRSEMERNYKQNVEVLSTSGTLENIERLQNGEADFALIQGAVPENNSVNFKDLAAIAAIGWQYVHIITPVDSDIKEFRDLAGRPVSMGPVKSGNAALGSLVFDYFPSSSRIKPVYSPIADAVEDFNNGKMEAFFTTYDLHAPVIENVLNTGAFRLVPIPEASAIAYSIPGCYTSSLPHSLYGPKRSIPARTPGDFPTLKIKTLLISRKDINRYVIHNLLKTIYSTRFVKLSRLNDLNESMGREVFDLPLHTAADRFYRRNEPVTADKYEIGSAFLAFLVFVASVFSFFINRYKNRVLEKRRKNIIPYFEELLQYSKRMAYVNNIEQLKDLLEHMMTMQRRAEKKWLTGDLDTEHMENLYAIYGIRCENIFHKMTLLQLIKNHSLLEEASKKIENEKKDS